MSINLREMAKLVFLAVVATPLWGQGSVWVVDDDGGAGVDFTDLQPAVDAAASGDILLVKNGVYASPTIVAKSLVVQADEGHAVDLRGRLVVERLGFGQFVVLRGLDVLAPLFADSPVLRNNHGTVVLEDCTLRNGNLGQFGLRPDALTVENSLFVSLLRSSFEASTGGVPHGGGHGLRSVASVVHLYDCRLEGGDGALGDMNDGGNGALVEDGFLFASGSELIAADGGDGVTIVTGGFSFCTSAGDGGSGLVLRGAGSRSVLLDNVLSGGAGGKANDPGCSHGVHGQPSVVQAGTLQALSGTSRGFQVTSPLREDLIGALSFRGEPEDFVFLFLSSEPLSIFVPLLHGPLLVDPDPSVTFLIGKVPPSGARSIQLTAPVLPASLAGVTFHFQAVFLARDGKAFAGPSSALALVDFGF